MCDEIRLVRHDGGETPWGFRLTGGRDFGTPLLVVKVVGGSIAALAGVHVGDIVRGINYVPTNNFTHLDAQRAILESGDTLILNLIRSGEYEEVPMPVIEVQSPEDKEVEEIGQQQGEDLELSFVIKLDRSGRISAVEEIPTPSTTPRTTPNPNAEKRRKSSGTGSGSGSNPHSAGASRSASRRGSAGTQEEDKKRKISVTFKDDGPISIEPPSYEDATNSKQETTESNHKSQNQESMKEVTLHEEMKLESSLKKTTTKITERSEEFVNDVRDEIAARAKSENRELTEEEIAEMMAGEAEVLDEKKGTIGVNFQKFLPKCDFIKDSSVFKVLQEEQTKKEKTEVEQLEKDPTKRFSKFLIKPESPVPLPKPKPVRPEPMAWQKKLENGKPEQNGVVLAETGVLEKKSEAQQVVQSSTHQIIQEKHISTQQISEQHLAMKIEEGGETTSSFSAKSAFSKTSTALTSSETNRTAVEADKEKEGSDEETKDTGADDNEEEEITKINLKENKEAKHAPKERKISSTALLSHNGRRSKTKKVGFTGCLESREDIERLLEQIQQELLLLQRLPIEIQDHLLIVQRSLQDIVAQHGQIQSPVEGEEKESGDAEGSDEEQTLETRKTDEEFERLYNESEDTKEISKEIDDEEVTEERKSIVEDSSVTTEENKSKEKHEVEESATEDKVEHVETATKEDTETVSLKDLPPGQEDVEILESHQKPGLPLTPQLRPMVLPGGRKWRQPKDAYNEEFIAETLISQSEVLVGTTIGVNFRKYIPPKFDTANSAVYRLIHEIEDKTKKGVAERPEKVHAADEFYHPPIDKRHFYAATLSADKTHVDNLVQQKYEPGA